jgi:Spy/CpxP family protein refolding chaperone
MSDITNTAGPVNEPPVKEVPKKKRNRKVIISVLVVCLIAVGVVGVGFAHKMHQFHQEGPWGFIIDKLSEGIDLNATQKTQVDQIKAEIKAKMEAKKDDHKKGMEEFEGLFRQSTLTKQQLIDIHAKREQDREDMKSFMMDEVIKFHDLLTDQQRNKVADKMKDFRENHIGFL